MRKLLTFTINKGTKMSTTQKHINMLGKHFRDRVTGFSGIATTVGFDLYGCIQVIINPGLGADGKLGDTQWFDANRLERTDKDPAMEVPDFNQGYVADGLKGPAEKPTSGKV